MRSVLRRIDNRPLAGRLRVLHVLAWTSAILATVEIATQSWDHYQTGQSVFNRLAGRQVIVVEPETGMQRLRPNAVVRGQRQEIRVNSLGLRSAELPRARSPGEMRIAVIGASSVMGVYARDNADTLPAMIEVRLRQANRFPSVNVINAGIAGAQLSDQTLMLEFVVNRLAPDVVIVYSGVNDFSAYCRNLAKSLPRNPYLLWRPELPIWLKSIDILRKSTVALRPLARASEQVLDPASLDLSGYRQRVESMVQAARERQVHIVMSTNARSYRTDQPLGVQEDLARLARFDNPCFDVAGLHVLYARHNAILSEVGARAGVPVIPVGELVPGGPQYFHDSVHFTRAGNALVAALFSNFLLRTYDPDRQQRSAGSAGE